MSKFKVGDRVRLRTGLSNPNNTGRKLLAEEGFSYMTKGAEFQVVRTNNENNVQIATPRGLQFWDGRRFELVDDTECTCEKCRAEKA